MVYFGSYTINKHFLAIFGLQNYIADKINSFETLLQMDTLFNCVDISYHVHSWGIAVGLENYNKIEHLKLYKTPWHYIIRS